MADNTTITAMTGGDVIATDDIGGVKYERVKVNYGVDGSATDVAPGAGLPIASAYVELTGSASANSTDLVASTDVRAHKSWSLQLTGTFVATIQVQGSNDNSTWFALPGCQAAGTVSLSSATSFTTAAIFCGPVVSRYIRVRTTAYTSGTVIGTLELTTQPTPSLSAFVYAAATSGDANALSSGFGVGAYAWNGSSWDRVRSATAAANTTGTGLPGVAPLYYDGTNYQRVASGAGGLPVAMHGAAAALSNVASSATSVTLLAANAARRGAVIYNDSTAVLYVKFGATASATSFTYYVAPGQHLEFPNVTYTGVIDGIWASANGSARVTELT